MSRTSSSRCRQCKEGDELLKDDYLGTDFLALLCKFSIPLQCSSILFIRSTTPLQQSPGIQLMASILQQGKQSKENPQGDVKCWWADLQTGMYYVITNW